MLSLETLSLSTTARQIGLAAKCSKHICHEAVRTLCLPGTLKQELYSRIRTRSRVISYFEYEWYGSMEYCLLLMSDLNCDRIGEFFVNVEKLLVAKIEETPEVRTPFSRYYIVRIMHIGKFADWYGDPLETERILLWNSMLTFNCHGQTNIVIPSCCLDTDLILSFPELLFERTRSTYG